MEKKEKREKWGNKSQVKYASVRVIFSIDGRIARE
jgi:hypothetical protein